MVAIVPLTSAHCCDTTVLVPMLSFLLFFVFCLDVDTRRRAACDLVHGLCKVFEGPVTAIFKAYVATLQQVSCREAPHVCSWIEMQNVCPSFTVSLSYPLLACLIRYLSFSCVSSLVRIIELTQLIGAPWTQQSIWCRHLHQRLKQRRYVLLCMTWISMGS